MRKAKQDDRRSEIVKLALPVIARYGIKKTTMENVAGVLGLRKTALYYYFKDKEELLRSVIDLEIQTLKLKILTVIENEPDPGRQLKKLFLARISYLEERSNKFTAFKTEFYQGIRLGSDILQKYSLWEKKILKDIVMKGKRKNLFKKALNTSSVVGSLTVALKGMEQLWATSEESPGLKKSVDTFLDVIFSGICTKEIA